MQPNPCQSPDAAQRAHALLAADPLNHVNLLYALDVLHADVLHADADGVVLRLDGLVYVTARDAAAAARLRPLTADAGQLLLHEDYYLCDEAVNRPGRFSQHMAVHPCIYEPDTPVSYALPGNMAIRRLAQSDAPFIHANYRGGTEPLDYIRGAIDRGMYGAFLSGALAGFIGTHDEGEMGLLMILPDYRRLHLAFALEAHLINRLLAEGRRPFGQVETHNAASLALQKKLGLTVLPATLHWLS